MFVDVSMFASCYPGPPLQPGRALPPKHPFGGRAERADGPPGISNDGATIVKLLEVEHPAAKALVDIAQSQVWGGGRGPGAGGWGHGWVQKRSPGEGGGWGYGVGRFEGVGCVQ